MDVRHRGIPFSRSCHPSKAPRSPLSVTSFKPLPQNDPLSDSLCRKFTSRIKCHPLRPLESSHPVAISSPPLSRGGHPLPKTTPLGQREGVGAVVSALGHGGEALCEVSVHCHFRFAVSVRKTAKTVNSNPRLPTPIGTVVGVAEKSHHLSAKGTCPPSRAPNVHASATTHGFGRGVRMNLLFRLSSAEQN